MEKVKQKNIKKYTFLAVTLIWLLFSMMLLYIKSRTSHKILIDFFGLILRQADVLFILLLMIVAWLIYFLKLFWKKYSSKIARIFLVMGWILLIVGFLFGSLIFLGDHFISSYHTFISPDKKYTLVVEEDSFLFLGDVSLYERKNLLFIEDLGAGTSLDDGFSPISAGKYWIKWDENRVNFAVFDGFGTRTWDVVKVSLGDSDRDVQHESLDSDGNPIIYEENDRPNPPRNHKIQKPSYKQKILDGSSKQEILDRLSIENAIIIPESNYGLIEVDRAMARKLWYFVRIEDDKMIYISEAPDTAPKVEGEIDSEGKVHLTFTDINNNQTKYESLNQGKTWKEK